MVKKASNKFNEQKFSEVLHYIIAQTTGKYNFGKTKLYKTLYFAEFNFFEKYEKLITNESYIKIQYGPAPKHFDKIAKELKEKKIIKEETKYLNNDKKLKSYISTKEPCYDFTPQELKEINTAIQLVDSMTAQQISAYSHDDTPWKVSKMNEEIDPMLVFYRDDKYSVTNKEGCESEL